MNNEEQIQIAVMDEAFSELLNGWQKEVYSQGEQGGTLHELSRHLKDWLGVSVSIREDANLFVERLVPERLSTRITQIARDGVVSRPHMLMSVVAMIDHMLQAMDTPEGARARRLWSQHLERSPLSRLWLARYQTKEKRTS